jgi:hypothetical protein
MENLSPFITTMATTTTPPPKEKKRKEKKRTAKVAPFVGLHAIGLSINNNRKSSKYSYIVA